MGIVRLDDTAVMSVVGGLGRFYCVARLPVTTYLIPSFELYLDLGKAQPWRPLSQPASSILLVELNAKLNISLLAATLCWTVKSISKSWDCFLI